MDSTAPSGLKIIIIGPSGSGKTAIANFLGGQTTNDTLEEPSTYNETKGVRILECERSVPGHGTKNIELWDVSGNSMYESGWAAVAQHTSGVVLVYNPEKAGNDNEVGNWFDVFVKDKGLNINDQCVVFAHHPATSAGVRHASKVPPKLKVAGVGVVETGFDSSSTTVLQQNFDDFLIKCVGASGR